jgi:hypothetical protein
MLLCCGVLQLAFYSVADASEEDMVTSVASKTSSDYVRLKRSDGSYPPESYAFGQGGFWSGMHDYSIDKLKFIEVARTIAGPLAAENYLPSKDPAKTKLLIMVYWGLTTVPARPSASPAFVFLQVAQTNLQMALASGNRTAIDAARAQVTFAAEGLQVENRLRDRTDWQNAAMIGYDVEMENTARFKGTSFQSRWDEVISDVEDRRYFVVLMAYDFELLWRAKKHKLLWETRFSIRQRNNDFDQQLAAMSEYASQYFGQDTKGLILKPLREGHVTLGEPKVLEYQPKKN